MLPIKASPSEPREPLEPKIKPTLCNVGNCVFLHIYKGTNVIPLTCYLAKIVATTQPGPALEAGKRGGRPGPPIKQGPTPKYANHTIIFNVFVYLYELVHMNIAFACRVKYL